MYYIQSKEKEKIMKKIIILIFALISITTLSSCDNKNISSSSTIENSSEISSSQQTENTTFEYSSFNENLTDEKVGSGDGGGSVPSEPLNVTDIVIHYFRFDGMESNYTIWLWQNYPTNSGGTEYSFNDTDRDSFGATITVPYTDNFEGARKIGIIVKKGPGWAGARDIDGDRFFILTDECVKNGVANLYLVQGTYKIGSTDTEMDKSSKITTAIFENTKKINVKTTSPASSYIVKADEAIVTEGDISGGSTSFNITLDKEIDLRKTYSITTVFSDTTKTLDVSLNNLYDTKEFNDMYQYDGKLGAIYTKNSTTFKVWAPTRSKISLLLYSTGSPSANSQGYKISGGSDTPIKTYEMTKGDKGVFSYKVDGDLDGTYYTYKVYDNGKETEIVDPYAESTGINGLRGMVIDMDKYNPTDLVSSLPHEDRNFSDAIVYELHVRDLTTSSTWNGSEINRSKYLGLVEEGTTYTENGITVKTGFDHIKELGVTDVQILPFFDSGVVDETRTDQPGYESQSFNWGYMPLNFNSLEGSYSYSPYDGASKVAEMKYVTNKFNQAGIGVIMDVVFNHTGLSADSNFNVLVPNYYYRMNEDGSFSNGSGTGNETASDRSMMRKFMLDSCLFYQKEYNLSGFRFDLMGLHDQETMNLISTELKKVDSSILVYGEPWQGGSSPLSTSQDSQKTNIDKLDGVGAFNDELRDAVKGSVWEASKGGFVSGDNSNVDAIKDGIMAKNSAFSGPDQVINYVSAHDNETLWDKLGETGVAIGDRPQAQIEANAIVLTSQGLSFLHAGAEICRTKINPDGSVNNNSYESPDSVNEIDWSRKITYMDVFKNYKNLIKLRLEHEAFRMTTQEEINSSINFLSSPNNVIAYEIKSTKDVWKDIIVVHCGTGYGTVNLPDGTWNQVDLTDSNFSSFEVSGTVVVVQNFTYVFYK